eukprot:s1934_g11.t1
MGVQILNQLEMDEMTAGGGLQRMLLKEAYGSRADERFEEREEALSPYIASLSCQAYHGDGAMTMKRKKRAVSRLPLYKVTSVNWTMATAPNLQKLLPGLRLR